MNIESLKAVGVDYADGLKRFSFKSDLYEKYLIKFFSDSTFDELGEFLEKGDYNNAFTSAHTLKGMAGNLSLKEFYESLCSLVDALRNNKTQGLNETYKSLTVIYEKLKQAIIG